MSTRIQVSIFENRMLIKSEDFDGPVELGREQNRDEGLYARRRDKGLYRWVVARREETAVGRSQIIVTPLDDGRVLPGKKQDAAHGSSAGASERSGARLRAAGSAEGTGCSASSRAAAWPAMRSRA